MGGWGVEKRITATGKGKHYRFTAKSTCGSSRRWGMGTGCSTETQAAAGVGGEEDTTSPVNN